MGKFFGGAGKDDDRTDAGRGESELVSALGEICQKYDKDLSELTWTQYYLYMDALGLDRIRQFRMDATAARLAQASGDDWQRFMEDVENDKAAGSNDLLDRIDKAEPKPNMNEDDVEWLKLDSQ